MAAPLHGGFLLKNHILFIDLESYRTILACEIPFLIENWGWQLHKLRFENSGSGVAKISNQPLSRNKGKLDRQIALQQYPKFRFVKIYIGGIAMPQKFANRVKMAMEKEGIATYAELSQQPV
jgi:hypothetical protein